MARDKALNTSGSTRLRQIERDGTAARAGEQPGTSALHNAHYRRIGELPEEGGKSRLVPSHGRCRISLIPNPPRTPLPRGPHPRSRPPPAEQTALPGTDASGVLAALERLGVLTDEEFAAKTELPSRL
jgi:hypothetical protein